MNTTEVICHRFEGQEAITLRTAMLETTVLPKLGAKIVSLQSRITGRQWLWRAVDGRPLEASSTGTAFEKGTLAGIDECLPTVASCAVDGKALPDHGEAWTRDWLTTIDGRAVVSEITLLSRPLRFRRRLSAESGVVELSYTLENLGPQPIPYVWALHALLAWRPGSCVELVGTSAVRLVATQGNELRAGVSGTWPEPLPGVRLDEGKLGASAGVYCKAFLDSAQAPAIALLAGTERLEMTVDPRGVPHWGYWLTLGGWHGHTHLALEPTNVPVDTCAEIPQNSKHGIIGPRASKHWTVKIGVSY